MFLPPMAPRSERPVLQPADVAACRASLLHNSRTFHAASLLLPRRVREPASVLYGFCRLADDAVDLDGGQVSAVERLRQRLDRVYAGEPEPVPADRALAAVVAQYGIPRELPGFLLEGLAWDTRGCHYETLEDLQAYAARVAGAVGAMMCLLMGVRDPHALARASDLGVAMQLSNIARDVGEDARMGRLYLPRTWMREAGLDPEAWLAAPHFDKALAGVVHRLLQAADALYARATSWPSAAYRRRARVPRHRKAWLLSGALINLWPRSQQLREPVLAANRPLLDAVAAAPHPGADAGPEDDGAMGFLVGLFERLERQDRLQRSVA
jgi:phytoene synthase